MSLLIRTMSRMMETIAEIIGSASPTGASRAMREGLSARVYEQMRRDFMVAAPFVLHAEFPPILASVWALVRETLMVGQVPRGLKETVAWTVSMVNHCPFCVDAHYAAVRAAHSHHPGVQAWARATGHANSPGVAPTSVRFTQYKRRVPTASAVAFNYLNRVVSVFLGDSMMPTLQTSCRR